VHPIARNTKGAPAGKPPDTALNRRRRIKDGIIENPKKASPKPALVTILLSHVGQDSLIDSTSASAFQFLQ
jgi:hypothetical protein